MITQETIQQIQSRIDIIEVVGSFVKLKKRGTNYLGLCPFHNEKTPSFTVSPAKEIYKCFGCGRSGNTIGFLMEHEKYSYTEALRWLAAKYNVPLEETFSSPEYKAQLQAAESLYILNQFARDFFMKQLKESDEGLAVARTYLRERGFRDDIIEKFQLGYNPTARDHFTRAALDAQYSADLLIKAGLSARRDEQMADNYRGRIIFPVHNQSGKVLGFGARVIRSNDKAPKYINTPENDIYIKSKILYGSYFARNAIDKQDECLLVEGYTDVISLHQAGIENVVASGGTSLTPDQLRLIKKYTTHLTIIYDGDSAGVKAALRGLDLALEEGLIVKLVLIPDKEDPDSYVRKLGADAFREFIHKEKKDFILFQLQVGLEEAGADIARKSAVVNQLAESISRIRKAEDFTRRQDYIKEVSGRLKIPETGFNELVNKIIRDKLAREDFKSKPETPQEVNPLPDFSEQTGGIDELIDRDLKHEKAMVHCLIEFGLKNWEGDTLAASVMIDALRDEQGNLNEHITDPLLQRMVLEYIRLFEDGSQPDARSFLYHPDPAFSQAMVGMTEQESELSPNWNRFYEGHLPTREEKFKDEILSTLSYLKLRKIKRMLEENQQLMETEKDTQQLMLLLEAHQILKKEETALTQRVGMVIFK